MIYLDHHATTPLDPRVREVMLPYLGNEFGNPHSRDHAVGWRAWDSVETARREVAAAIGAEASEIVFTSGATEANNMALRGIEGGVLASAIEHPSVQNARDVLILTVGQDGLVDAERLANAITGETRLVSVALVNHELGVVQPIEEIARVCHDKGMLLHADCAQALGKTAVNVRRLDVDLASFSAHKAYGPMGIGAQFIRRGIDVKPLITGGGQEMGLRAGTVPLPLAVGFGAAANIASRELEADRRRIGGLQDNLLSKLKAAIPGLRVNGSMTARIPGNLSLTLPSVEAEAFMLEMPEVAISAGSACASGSDAPSAVLSAIGLAPEAAARTVRLCLGRFTAAEEMEQAAALMIAAWRRLAAERSPS